MSIIIWKDNTSPSVNDTIKVNKAVYDLTGCTVDFRMRADGGDGTLKVDSPAAIVNHTAGQVRYDWDIGDTDTAGDFLAWWHVTLFAGGEQDTSEFEIRIDDHSDANLDYVTLAELKNSLAPTANVSAFAEDDMRRAIRGASIGVETICRRRFWLDASAVDRVYTATSDILQIDDLSNATTPTVTVAGTDWTAGVDYVLEPLNAPLDGKPYEQIRFLTSLTATSAAPAAVSVHGNFGWPEVPTNVSVAAGILAGKLLIRMQQAPLGFATLGVDGVAAIRIGSTDPDVLWLLDGLIRLRNLKSLPLQ